jgi:anti-sigma-K factor RskA
MSDTNDHNGTSKRDLPEDELVAAEYALGVLSGAAHAAAAQRVTHDAAFARRVAAWEEKLAPLAAEIEEAAPPPRVWEAIGAALPPAPVQSSGLWQNHAFWRGFGLVSAVAAASLAGIVYFGSAGRGEPLVAQIDGGGHHHFVATVDARRGSVAVLPAAFAGDATGRVPELWLIPADGKPRPLGLLSADRSVTIAVPADLAPLTVRNAVLAVSLEPPGGSPTGQPTGPVIAQGKLTTL